jgi:iduronate 2-sulfatase
LYYASLLETDTAIGKILDWLDASPFASNTLVVYSVDHGDMMAAHGGEWEKFTFYEESARVPLIFALPGVIPAGKIVPNPVSTMDMAPTILSFLVNGNGSEKMQGRSLQHLILSNNASGLSPFSFAQWGKIPDVRPNWMVRSATNKLMMWQYNSGKVDGYYDLTTDPHELDNLIGHNPNREKSLPAAQAMKRQLVVYLKSIGSPSAKAVDDHKLE